VGWEKPCIKFGGKTSYFRDKCVNISKTAGDRLIPKLLRCYEGEKNRCVIFCRHVTVRSASGCCLAVYELLILPILRQAYNRLMIILTFLTMTNLWQ